MPHSINPKNSEVDAYSYIKEQLENLGWIVKNPARVPEGEVYKQNESLSNNNIKECLGRDMPEAIIKLNESEFWIIESKRDKKEINKAIDEVKNQYAKKINQSKKIKCVLISGVAGNDTDGYTVINQYLHNGEWKTLLFNEKPKDTLLSKEQVQYIIKNKTINYNEFPDFPEEKYFSSAEKINEILHNAGINKNKRARFIAGLILSLSMGEEIDIKIKNSELLVKNINNLIEQKLKEVKKSNFYPFINLEVPPSEENHIKYRQAIIDTLNELQTLDIKNAMASGNDILGKFYEKFLKYGNGAKEIGIVLTPRHITEFAVSVLDIRYNDYVLDPCCGTGGFLVSAFDYVKKNSNKSQIDKFKNYNIFGIEQDDEVVALALVNMIFRGDGKNNMSEGNCFQKNIIKIEKSGIETGKYDKREGKINKEPIISKVVMNPPFALENDDEKEYRFIDYALSQMQDGGVLFSILPYSTLSKSSGYDDWRKELIKNNTLLSVITFPEDLFYPIGVFTLGVFIKKGIQHPKEQNVLWIRALNDGFFKKKGKRLYNLNAKNDFKEVKDTLKAFLQNHNLKINNIRKLIKLSTINFEDPRLELVPEVYLDDNKLIDETITKEMKYLMKEVISFKVKYNEFLSKKNYVENIENDDKLLSQKNKLKDLFDIGYGQREYHSKEYLKKGKTIVISSQSTDNGCYGFFDVKAKYKAPFITLPSTGTVGEAAVQEFDCCVDDNCLVLIPKTELSLTYLYFIASILRLNKWRFSYGGRKVTPARIEEMKMPYTKPPIKYNTFIEKMLEFIKIN